MISQSGVMWNREQNYIYASPNQWALWREMFPMARAYMTHGEPLYTELRALFAPDDGPQDDPTEDDDIIIIVDNKDENFQPLPQPVVHALPALEQVDLNYIIIPDSPVPEVVMISSDDDDEDLYGYFISDDENEDLYGYFDSDVDLEYNNDENHIPVVMVEEAIGEVVDPVPIINVDDIPT